MNVWILQTKKADAKYQFEKILNCDLYHLEAKESIEILHSLWLVEYDCQCKVGYRTNCVNKFLHKCLFITTENKYGVYK